MKKKHFFFITICFFIYSNVSAEFIQTWIDEKGDKIIKIRNAEYVCDNKFQNKFFQTFSSESYQQNSFWYNTSYRIENIENLVFDLASSSCAIIDNKVVEGLLLVVVPDKYFQRGRKNTLKRIGKAEVFKTTIRTNNSYGSQGQSWHLREDSEHHVAWLWFYSGS